MEAIYLQTGIITLLAFKERSRRSVSLSIAYSTLGIRLGKRHVNGFKDRRNGQ